MTQRSALPAWAGGCGSSPRPWLRPSPQPWLSARRPGMGGPRLTPGFLLHGFLVDQTSSIFGVWAAPAAPEAIPKGQSKTGPKTNSRRLTDSAENSVDQYGITLHESPNTKVFGSVQKYRFLESERPLQPQRPSRRCFSEAEGYWKEGRDV